MFCANIKGVVFFAFWQALAHYLGLQGLGYDLGLQGLGYDLGLQGLGYDLGLQGLGYDLGLHGLGYDNFRVAGLRLGLQLHFGESLILVELSRKLGGNICDPVGEGLGVVSVVTVM